MRISAIIPAFDEEKNIRKTILRSIEGLRSLFEQFEIIIVDDASKDETGRIADALAVEHSEITVIHNAANVGQGGCQLIGFENAKYELVTHNGMDYPFDFNDLSKMLPLLENADIVVAARSRRAGYSLFRKIVSVTNVFLIQFLFPLRLRDYNFVQLFRKDAIDTAAINARSAGFVIPEILIRAYDAGFRIKEIEIEYHAREHGIAKSGNFRVILDSACDMLKFWWKRRNTSGLKQC